MGRAPCCEKVGLKKGRWTAEEDEILTKYIQENGEGSWRSLPKNAGLLRCGKSCRLRWINYLKADLKRGNISSEEEDIIIKLHASVGNKWSLIASQLPGRTDNEIKNYWNSHLSRRIDTFRRSNSEPLPLLIKLNQKGNNVVVPAKRKGGRTSRAAMKKNEAPYTNRDAKVNSSSWEENKEISPSPSINTWNEDELESLVLDSWVVSSPCQDIGEGRILSVSSEERDSLLFSHNEDEGERESCSNSIFGPADEQTSSEPEMLGPLEETLDLENYGALSVNEIMDSNPMPSPRGVWLSTTCEERERGVLSQTVTSEDPESGSNGGSVDNWHSSSPMTTYFDGEIGDWEWENVIHDQELDNDQDGLISWLWEGDNFEVDM